jgi:tetratricopeptide (TPR) repeat protein
MTTRKLPLLIGALVPIALLVAIGVAVYAGHTHGTDQASKRKPLHPVTIQRMEADKLYGKRDLKQARKAYEAIIAKNAAGKDKKAQDEVAAARMRLGYVVAKTEGYAKAREVFLIAAKSYKGSGAMSPEFGRPDDQAAYQAAVCLVAEGKKDEARKEFQKLVVERPKSPIIYLAFRRMQRLGDPNKEEEGQMQASIAKQEAWMKFEMSVCGPKAIVYLLERLGRPAKDYHEVAKLCGTTERGTDMQAMRDCLKQLGVETAGLMVNRRDFAELTVPALWLDKDHYVVLIGVKGTDAEVYDTRFANRTVVKLPPLDDPSFMATVLVVRNSPQGAPKGITGR